jgi:riboflavin synthase
MFSGIVEEIGTIRELGSHNITVEAHVILADTRISDSIAVSGICLTVSQVGADWFRASVMPETFRCTNLGVRTAGCPVNLERAVTPSSRLGGHIVLGHVDGVGRVVSVVAEDQARMMTVGAAPDVMRYIAMKGSVTVDGVSLTVAHLAPDSFAVSLVSFTCAQTTLGTAKTGQTVNLEVDVLARYIERLQQTEARGSGITWDMLQEHGY